MCNCCCDSVPSVEFTVTFDDVIWQYKDGVWTSYPSPKPAELQPN